MSETQSAPQPGDAARRFVLQRIYLKDLSFESPASPQLFSADWQPQVRLEIGTRSTEVADSIYEVIIQITITAEQEGKTAFLIEVQQAGLFHITGVEERLMPQVLQVTCPTVLFPYVRETVDTMALKGSIPPLLLAPIDFEALRRQMEEVRQQESDASGLS